MSENDIRAELAEMSTKVTAIHETLVGSLDKPGFLEKYRQCFEEIATIRTRLEATEKAVENLRRTKAQLISWGSGVCFVVGIGWAVFTHFAK